MCAPAAVAGGVAIATAIASAVATGVQVDQENKRANYAAAVALNNAKRAAQARNDAMQRGAAEARKIEIEGRDVGEMARSELALSGLASSSADRLAGLSSVNAAVDADIARANAIREAWGLQSEERQYRATAKMERDAGVLGSLGTGLSGFSRAAGQATEGGVQIYKG